MTAEAFVAAARGFIGAPWVHQGRSDKGMDCVGLIVLAARSVGIDAPLKADYGRFQYYPQAREYLEQFCDRVGSPELGDIVLFKTTQSLHMAIVSEVTDGRIARVIQALGHKSNVVDTALQFPPLQLWRLRWPS
ncbi:MULTISPECIES: NlpC/P60 family protein [unclassified Mesorhizobium]|uniref:C40 family peptidase n=1 Tax=unclassified Mesorhizobium TaxID=325217 RepID=UPI000FD8B45E|nr:MULTISPECIES: NlpC/P60 family protein [unclassified Mesorhizobium]TGT76705.1 peptidoglycan endopeptidase [Mesorhizobium sp. M2E.F.Ca.ET.166.01.1.1]TGW02817.1 peptidoglycan endopeptidase [Mesorhizobium sp. M2E.F.Ca.ET.154.01.1.1]